MFTHQKKDYYSVNANISLNPITEQQTLQQMLEGEQKHAMKAMNSMQDHSMQMSQQDADSASGMNQDHLMNETQNRMVAIAEHIQNPVSTRYDDIYHPRTDKKVIRGNQYTYQGNAYNKAITQGNSVEENITKIIQNQEDGRCPIEFSNILSRAKVIEMKGIKPNDKCRSFTGLYQDSQCLSEYHQRQKFGLRSGEVDENSKTVQKATFQNEAK